MTIYAIPPLISSVLFIALGLFVMFNNPRSKINQTFGLACVATFWWQFSWFILFNFGTEKLAKQMVHIGYIGIIFIPILFYHFFILFLEKNGEKHFIIFAYLLGIFFLFSNLLSNLFISDFYKYPWGYYPKANILHVIYMLFLFIMAVRVFIFLIAELAKSRSASFKHIQIKYLLFAFGIYILASIDFAANYGLGIYPPGFLFIMASLIILAYTIARHRLMDINIIIRKTAIYSLVTAVITILYFTLIYIMETFFRGFVGYRSIPWTLSIIALFSLIFQPLKNVVQLFVDKYFFKGSLIAELERAQEELRRIERLKAVGTLAAGMAHEIKNPLTGIKSFTEYLPSKGGDPEFRDKFYKIVSNEVNKINDIVQQLLDFSKPKPLKLQQHDIHKVIDQTLSFLSNDLIKYRIEAVKNYASPLLLNIDPLQMQQVFLNLFLNAIDAMKHGGRLIISTTSTANAFEITIEDTGTGMSQKDIEHIFDPFYSTKETGTGLGMSIVYGIIKEHRGDISVESESGKGTRFRIRLPI